MTKNKFNLGFGGASLTSMKSYTDVKDLLNTAYQEGIRHFDTAVLYGKGYSELIYGHFLKDKRQDVTITTKFGLGNPSINQLIPIQVLLPLNYYFSTLKKARTKTTLPLTDEPHQPVAYRQIDKALVEQSFKNSLKRLKTEYIDYYLLHEGLPHFLTDEALSFLLNLKKQGRVGAIGIGTNVHDIKTLKSEAFKYWDVLQYEGNDAQMTLKIMQQFPDKTHFHHSCLKNRDMLRLENIEKENKVGYTLAQCAAQNPNGKILFSTRHKDYLQNNINSYKHYYKNPTFQNS